MVARRPRTSTLPLRRTAAFFSDLCCRVGFPNDACVALSHRNLSEGFKFNASLAKDNHLQGNITLWTNNSNNMLFRYEVRLISRDRFSGAYRHILQKSCLLIEVLLAVWALVKVES
jgi:hypothetical protein